jgi:geranylgeranyl diphosphate synthase type II
MRYSCLAPGKRLRPALCLASAEAVAGSVGVALDAACALEMVHCFSLIHDDLPEIDNDDLRRGVPTCHIKFGEAIALLAGDALFALAFQCLANVQADPGIVVQALRSLSLASGSEGLVGGEVMDVLSEGKPVSDQTLQFIHSRKTGALIAASCEIGGLLAGGTQEQVFGLKSFGEKIGLAFQIVDDLLNELSTSEQLGKAAGSDRARQKATYPALHGVTLARETADRLLEEAVSGLPSSLERGTLEELARYAVERIH